MVRLYYDFFVRLIQSLVSPELRNCRPRDYLSSEVFPTIIPALNQMLRVAKVTEVSKTKTIIFYQFQRRKRFNPLDFLAEYLYR